MPGVVRLQNCHLMILELTDKEKERLNRISRATGETPAAILKAILMAYGTPAALPVPGPGTHGLKTLIAVLQPYLDDLIQMGTLSDGTRKAAADFYDNLLMDLAVEARREGKALKISKQN